MRIFLDMDGTIVDFDKGLYEFNIRNDTSFLHRPRSEWTPLEIKLDKEVVDCMNTPGFFRDLPMMPGADKLWMLAKRPYILTAWPKTCNDKSRVGREKREWIYEHFGEVSDDRFIYCAREDKSKYAITDNYPWPSSNVLIDDMVNNCEAWERSGGIAIQYRNMNEAINDLSKILART